MFSGWLRKEEGHVEPVGLEAAKQKVLGEAIDPNDPRLLALKKANPDSQARETSIRPCQR